MNNKDKKSYDKDTNRLCNDLIHFHKVCIKRPYEYHCDLPSCNVLLDVYNSFCIHSITPNKTSK